MRILFVSAEVAPFSKTGGLGDVAQSLPTALAARGLDVAVVTPRHASVPRERLEAVPGSLRISFPFGEEVGRLWRTNLGPRYDVYFLEHAAFFDRPEVYGPRGDEYPDNARRFAFLSLAALAVPELLGWVPDVVHLNDWHTALGALALKRGYRGRSFGRAPALLTLHNLAYQGLAPKSAMDDLGLPWELFNMDQLEHFDQVNFLKGGIAFADVLTTVSPRYAREICTAEGGWGLDGVLRKRQGSLHGILNGIDVRAWNPAADPQLPAAFDAEHLAGKAACKAALIRETGLSGEDAAERPLFAAVGRLASQKGVDLLLELLPRLLRRRASALVVGTGELRYEVRLQQLASAFPDQLKVRLAFDEGLAHRVEAGADFFLMPSRYEPCGLNQLYSLRYGTLPIVRATGGLDDTVVDLRERAGTGFKFADYTVDALAEAVERALELYGRKDALASSRMRGMQADFSWDRSAEAYRALYKSLLPPGKAK